MKSPAIEKIDELMRQGRWDEAQKAMEEMFASETLYDAERGRSFLTYTMMYLEALVSINQQYKAALEQATALLKSVNKAEAQMDEDADLTRLDAEISKLQ